MNKVRLLRYLIFAFVLFLIQVTVRAQSVANNENAVINSGTGVGIYDSTASNNNEVIGSNKKDNDVDKTTVNKDNNTGGSNNNKGGTYSNYRSNTASNSRNNTNFVNFNNENSGNYYSLLSFGIWKLTAVSGEIKMGALYGVGTTQVYGLKDTSRVANYFGGLSMRTSSFIWNPNFMKIDIDGSYFPQSNEKRYTIYPSYFDVYNVGRLHISATLLPKKLYSLNGYYNLDGSYDNRENYTDIKTDSKSYGGIFNFRNKVLPFSVSYNTSDWNSKEIATGRYYSYDQHYLDGRFTKSFRKGDRTELIFTKRDYSTTTFTNIGTTNLSKLHNDYENVELRNSLILDSSKTSTAYSDINVTRQVGIDSYQQARINESLIIKMPHNLKFTTNYSFINTKRPSEFLMQNDLGAILGHQLFQSLHTDILYEYVGSSETSYVEDNHKLGFNLSYNKKIIKNGTLSLGYSSSILHEKRESSDVMLQIMNEPYILNDAQIVMLKVPYVDVNSVSVRDATGTIVYISNIDYRLIENDGYIQIVRIPGGQIPNNTTVYLYYNAKQPGNIEYNLYSNNMLVNLSLFGQLLNLYYTRYSQSYGNVKNTDNLNLNYLVNNIYGSKISYKFITIGAEYNDYRSSIYPYQIIRYFLIVQGNINQRFNYAINASEREYLKMKTDSSSRVYEDVSGMIAYRITRRTKLDVTAAYQYQNGYQMNLDYLTARVKLTKVFRSLTGTLGIDMFNRQYLLSQKTNYFGGFIQIIKKF